MGIRDALIRASSRGEVTLMVYADYCNAFDTVQFRSVVSKMHSLGFSKYFLLWMIDYLTHRRQLVQIDDRESDMATVEFDVPQGSTLGPDIFNLYVAALQSVLQCDCYQYADDTTFYIHSKPCDLDPSADYINKAVTNLRDYSGSCNLALNSSKTNWMLISTPQMARYHSLEERKLPIACGDTPLKRVSCTKLPWVSGVSGGKGERWKRKRQRAEGEKRLLTQMLLLEPSTPTQHDSIPSNQNHFRSLVCQLHASKSSPKIVNCFCLQSYNGRSLISRFLRVWLLKSWFRSGRESSEGKSIFLLRFCWLSLVFSGGWKELQE